MKPWKLFANSRRNVLPPLAGLLVMALILGAFNAQYLTAQWQYRAAPSASAVAAEQPQPVVNGESTANPNQARGPYLSIPSIGVEAPIVFEPSFEEPKVQVALRDGVVHYGDTPNPGQAGNMVILGHSSGQPWAKGNYKFVFTLLEKVTVGQNIVVDYQETRYTYRVTQSYVVSPADTTPLAATDKPSLTLITCTPVGTSTNRLIVKAELISPVAPAGAARTADRAADTTAPSAAAQNPAPSALPASASGSLWQRFLDLF